MNLPGLPSYDPALTSSGLPPVDAARQPADIRNGNAQAKQAYQQALGFEDMLFQQLTQEMAKTVTASGGSDDSGGSSSGGILGSDPSTNMFAGMIPTTLTQSIMSGGGVGIADQLARAIDPAIGTPQGSAGSTSVGSTSTGSAAGAQP